MNGNYIGVIVVLLIIIAGGWFFLSGTTAKAPTVTNQMPVIGSTTPEMTVENATPEVTVTYTDQGFSPNSVSVALGTKVNFINKSTKNIWVASAKHPDHTVYSGTSLSQHCPDTTNSAFDACAVSTPGGSYSFTFNKKGTWKYHDHVDATKFGTVIVTPTVSATVSVPASI